jgi:diamine N-acetyltransferase
VTVAAKIEVRPAVAADAERMALLGCATFLETYAQLLPVADILSHAVHQHSATVYARWLADSQSQLWLAEHLPGLAPVGYAVLTTPDLPDVEVQQTDVELRRIYLLHRFQGSGVGATLLTAAQVGARQRGANRILLGVYSRNERALAFYARGGFEQIGTRQFRVGSNVYFDYILALNL